ncbi:MAG: phosphatidylserine/phosphatidylglycerophosphate/cardiolipin synthase family protein [Christensenellaceae bacterium]
MAIRLNLRFLIAIIFTLSVVLGTAYLIFYLSSSLSFGLIAYVVLLGVTSLLVITSRLNVNLKTFYLLIIYLLPFVGISVTVISATLRLFSDESPVKKDDHRQSAPLSALQKNMPQYAKVGVYVDYFTNFSPLFADESKLFFNGEEYLNDIIDEIDKAEKYVCLEFYIMRQGRLLSQLVAVLFNKLKSGVTVKIAVDYFGSKDFVTSDTFRELKKAGAQIKVYKPPYLLFGINFNKRTHRKIVVIDGKTGYVGGINFSDDYLGTIKDVGVKLYGDSAKQLEAMIYRLDKATILTDFANEDKGLGYCQPYSVNGKNLGEGVFLGLMSVAKHSVDIATPYLGFSENVKNAFKYLIANGVRVRILIPDKVSKIIYLNNLSFAKILESMGAEVYFYKPAFMHEKLIAIDGKVCQIGSLNFDLRSSFYQVESGVIFYDNRVIDDLLVDFNLALASSYTKEDNVFRLSLGDKIFQRISLMLCYFL